MGVLSRTRALFDNPWSYVAWFLASASLLVVAANIHPHVFGLAAFCAAAVSGVIALVAAAVHWRRLPWALMAALPTALAFLQLSKYKWA